MLKPQGNPLSKLSAMNTYYVYMLASRNHKYLSVKATTDLKHGVKHHRRRISRSLGRKNVYQKVVYVESFDSLTGAIGREREIRDWSETRQRQLVTQRNPTWKPISIRAYLARGEAKAERSPAGRRQQSSGLQGAS